jgi:hypothetical protein
MTLSLKEANEVVDAARTPTVKTAIVKKIAGKGTMGPMLLIEALLDPTPAAQHGSGGTVRHIPAGASSVRAKVSLHLQPLLLQQDGGGVGHGSGGAQDIEAWMQRQAAAHREFYI